MPHVLYTYTPLVSGPQAQSPAGDLLRRTLGGRSRVGGCSAASWRSSRLSSPCCASRHPSGCPCDCPCRCPSHGSCGCPCGCSASAPGRAAPRPILRASPPRAPRWLTQPSATPPHSPPRGRVGAVGAVGAVATQRAAERYARRGRRRLRRRAPRAGRRRAARRAPRRSAARRARRRSRRRWPGYGKGKC